MIYVDTSVILARLFAEDRFPPDGFWDEPLVSSRLTEYEVLNRIHSRKAEKTHGEAARDLLGRMSLAELSPHILARALEPFPVAVRTLDGLHLATFQFLSAIDPKLELATYDQKLAEAAHKMKFQTYRF